MSWLLDRSSRLLNEGSIQRGGSSFSFFGSFRFVSGSVNSRDPEASNPEKSRGSVVSSAVSNYNVQLTRIYIYKSFRD